jgi:hypothetical protein
MKYSKAKPLITFIVLILISCTHTFAADLVWHYSEEDAFSEAAAQGKKIILFAGRNTCSNCNYMKNTVFETTDPPIKDLLEAYFVLWFCNIDQSTEHYDYRADLGSYYLPLICIIDPESENLYEDRSTSIQSASVFYNRILPYATEAETTTWSLISINIEPDDPDITSVLASIIDQVKSVWTYKDGQWQVFDPENTLLSEFSEMECGAGYWVKYTGEFEVESDLSVTGTENETPIDLAEGWNLVGYPLSAEQDTSEAMSSIEGNFSSVWAYKEGKWLVYNPENSIFNDLDKMEPGYGYWIKAVNDCTWTCN